jgi:hypothetical protein
MIDFDPIAEPDPARPECAAGQAALQRLLDGEADWDSPEAAAHRSSCQACREELVLAGAITKPQQVVVPAGLSDRVLNRALVARRRGRIIRYAGVGAALAASVVVAIIAFRPPTTPDTKQGPVAIVPAPKVDPPHVTPAKPLGDSVTEAREAIASLTRRAVETSDQSARLLPKPGMPETPDVGERLEPLADARTGAARSVEPMRDSARRAFNLFIRAADPPERRD